MPISKIKSSAIDANAITGSSIADGTVTSADLDTNIDITGRVSSGTLGVGTSTIPSGKVAMDASSNNYIRFADGGSLTGIVGLSDGGTLVTGTTDGDFVIRTEASGGALVFGGTGGGKWGQMDADGLKFNGDTAAANALDDYEEGDFAYTMPFSTSGSMTVRSGYERGYYTKVGRKVTIHLRFESNGNSGGLSGDLRIAGFPFNFASVAPASSNVSYVYPLHLRGVSSTSFDYDLSFYFLADAGTNYGRVLGQGEGNTHAQKVIDSGDIPTNIEGTLSFTYLVD